MIEMKQLQAFVVCADVHSFSRAAEVLYTSQPNISKLVRGLENELGYRLFLRTNRGIQLTRKGKTAYESAAKIIREEERLSDSLLSDNREEFCVAFNPSSWFAGMLTDYYVKFRRDAVRYSFLEGSVNDVIELVGSGRADIGFVFYLQKQQSGFTYRMQRQNLFFTELERTTMWLYYGRGRREPDDMQLIQCYEDEFAFSHYWNRNTDQDFLGDRVSVVTNSDYVMNRMLRKTDLCNISSRDLGDHPEFDGRKEDAEVIFGYLRRNNEELSDCGQELIRFLDSVSGQNKNTTVV